MTSAVVTSLTGYHILKVLTYSEPKILALDDVISPETTVTIRAYITDQLSQPSKRKCISRRSTTWSPTCVERHRQYFV